MGKKEPESRYKTRSSAEQYASFFSTRRRKYRAVPSGESRYPWKLQRVEKPKKTGVLERMKRRLAPRAARGRAGVKRVIKKRVTKRRIPRKRKTTTRRKRRRRRR